MAAAMDLSEWEADPRLFLFTSLTAGSSHIITATSRLETILKANKIPFQAVDTATDEKARRLWGRRAGKRKIPGLVKEGYVIGDLEEIEEWNEFGELKENIGPVPANNTAPSQSQTQASTSNPTSTSKSSESTSIKSQDPEPSLPMRDAAAQAASIGLARAGKPPVLVDESKIRPMAEQASAGAAESASEEVKNSQHTTEKEETASSSIDSAPKVETMNTSADEKKQSIKTADNAEPEASTSKYAGPAEPAEIAPSVDESLNRATNRFSGHSQASKGEIKTTEETTAVPDESDQISARQAAGEGEGNKEPVEEAVAGRLSGSRGIAEKADALDGEQSEMGTRTQEQGSKEAESAGVSVED